MTRTLLLVATLLCAPAGADVESDAIVGVWATDEEKSHVEIVRDGEQFGGRIVWLGRPTYEAGDEQGMDGLPIVDRDNPDETLRDQPLVGLTILHGLRYHGDGEWKEGRIYDPESGKTYRCKMRLGEGGTLKVRGFIGVSLLGRTTTWTPVRSRR